MSSTKKGAKYISGCNAKCAFVSTNSICQGDSVSLLWPNIFANNVEIDFAYQSFKWCNNARYNAGVTVCIIGLSNLNRTEKKLFINNQQSKCEHINGYLLAAPEIIIERRKEPISNLPKMVFGNKPTDGGNLILTPSERDKIIDEYPDAKKFIRIYQGSDSFINGETRYCIWVGEDERIEAESFPPLKNRIKAVADFRNKSVAESTVDAADYPHLFRQRAHRDGQALLVPRVSSERRQYIPIGFVNSNTIASDSTQVIYGAALLTFAILANRMHTIWLSAVGGKLETRYRYSNL